MKINTKPRTGNVTAHTGESIQPKSKFNTSLQFCISAHTHQMPELKHYLAQDTVLMTYDFLDVSYRRKKHERTSYCLISLSLTIYIPMLTNATSPSTSDINP
jgi:hypothetical protein